MGSKELLSSVFQFPAGIIIDSIDPSANELVIGIARFAHSLCKDKDAVVAGLTLSVSNGPVEALVHKRETWSNAPCLVALNFRCYGNACSMQLDLDRHLHQLFFLFCL
jgi:hypothetical protein